MSNSFISCRSSFGSADGSTARHADALSQSLHNDGYVLVPRPNGDHTAVSRQGIWKTPNEQGIWPEMVPQGSDSLAARTADCGVCLSGGGTRAMVAAMGQLSALHSLGLLSRTRYLSAVSGGSWAATIYCAYAGGDGGDDLLLGKPRPPVELTLEELDKLPHGRLAHPATLSLRNALLDSAYRSPPQRLWLDAIRNTYFQPFGEQSPPPTPRPFLIVNGCVCAPLSFAPVANPCPVPLEFTPLYSGCPTPAVADYGDGKTLRVDGVCVDTVSFGAGGGAADVPSPFTAAAASGVSSAAPAEWAAEQHIKPLPHLSHVVSSLGALVPTAIVPHTAVEAAETATPGTGVRCMLGDGGDVENYGLLSLLRRGVKRVIVFANAGNPVDVNWDPDPDAMATGTCGVCPYLPPLFGIHREVGSGVDATRNHVFPEKSFRYVVRELQSAKRKGRGSVADTELDVLSNEWWGVKGGWKVRILWVHLDHAPEWEAALPSETRDDIMQGRTGWFSSGSFKNFPHYSTAGQNHFAIEQYTGRQVSLLAHQTCWTVMEHASLIREFFCDNTTGEDGDAAGIPRPLIEPLLHP